MALVLAATALSIDGKSNALPLGLSNPAAMVVGILTARNLTDLLSGYRSPVTFDLTGFVLAW